MTMNLEQQVGPPNRPSQYAGVLMMIDPVEPMPGFRYQTVALSMSVQANSRAVRSQAQSCAKYRAFVSPFRLPVHGETLRDERHVQ